MDKKIQLYRSSNVYATREAAVEALMQMKDNEAILDGEPMVATYVSGSSYNAILGVKIVKQNGSIKKMYLFDLEEVKREAIEAATLTAGDAIDITDNIVSLKLSASEDNVAKIDENDGGVYVSLNEILENVDVSDQIDAIQNELDKTQEAAFGENVGTDFDITDKYADDQLLSGSTSLVDADKKLSEIIADNELAISAAFNDLNDRINGIVIPDVSMFQPEIEKTQIVAFGETIGLDYDLLDEVANDENLSGATSLLDGEHRLSRAISGLEERIDDIIIPDISTLQPEIDKSQEAAFGEDIDMDYNFSDHVSGNTILSGSTSLLENDKKLERAIADNELAISAAFNDLNDRINDIVIPDVSAFQPEIDKTQEAAFGEDIDASYNFADHVSGNTLLSGATSLLDGEKMLERVILNDELVSAAAFNDLNDRINAIVIPDVPSISGSSEGSVDVTVTNVNGVYVIEANADVIDGGVYA